MHTTGIKKTYILFKLNVHNKHKKKRHQSLDAFIYWGMGGIRFGNSYSMFAGTPE